MKNIIHTLLFLLISASAFQANSQTVFISSANPAEQKITYIKTFESRYFNNKVYLHITATGNTETKIVAVERSLDATNFEVIGYIKIYGTSVQADLAYFFTDESPVVANLYYRLSVYSFYNEPAYSQTVDVMPIDKNKAPTSITTIASVSHD